MKFTKIYNVKSPKKGTNLSAGIDFYIPELSGSFLRDFLSKNDISIDAKEKSFRLSPNERVNIPSGIIVEIKENQVLIAFNKSGVSTKLGLDVLANVVDADYQGQIHLSVVNTSNNYIDLYCGQKLVQFILFDLPFNGLIEVKKEQIHIKTTNRGKKGFGSTGV